MRCSMNREGAESVPSDCRFRETMAAFLQRSPLVKAKEAKEEEEFIAHLVTCQACRDSIALAVQSEDEVRFDGSDKPVKPSES